MSSEEPTDPVPPKPRLRARLTILLIGGVALLGIVVMCLIVFGIIASRT